MMIIPCNIKRAIKICTRENGLAEMLTVKLSVSDSRVTNRYFQDFPTKLCNEMKLLEP
jgi:hypothetical protein